MVLNEYETIEHRILSPIFGKDSLTARYDREDIHFTYKDNKIIIGEFKARNFTHKHFDTWFIEKKKYDALQKIDADKRYYINYFLFDECLVIWDLEKVFRENNVKTDKRLMNVHSTEGFKKYGQKELKDVYLLKLEYATIIKENYSC